jgi:hypothetical protein
MRTYSIRLAVELNRRDKPSLATIRGMARYRHNVYANDTTPRWVAVFGLQWQVIESHRMEPATDLYGAMTAAIQRLAADGWQIKATPRFGFSFIRRDGERRLLMLTPRDPYDTTPQSFNPVSGEWRRRDIIHSQARRPLKCSFSLVVPVAVDNGLPTRLSSRLASASSACRAHIKKPR